MQDRTAKKMSDGVRNLTQEYWRPVQPPQAELGSITTEALCSNCGTEYAIGARFCHVCGNERQPETSSSTGAQIIDMVDFDQLCSRLHMTAASLVFTFLGFGCALAALLVGIIYTANTVLDWQAVQVWRIEWMIGALVAFVAAILFNGKKAA